MPGGRAELAPPRELNRPSSVILGFLSNFESSTQPQRYFHSPVLSELNCFYAIMFAERHSLERMAHGKNTEAAEALLSRFESAKLQLVKEVQS